MLAAGSTFTVVVERPAIGGAMLARYDGEVVLIDGAIPGETVRARVHSRARSVAHATVLEVVDASPDRVSAIEPACGGRDYAHIARGRQRALKGDQVADALRRIAKRADVKVLETTGDDRPGYRVRARLHWNGLRLGFLRAQSHQVCIEGIAEQLSPPAARVTRSLEAELASHDVPDCVVELGESLDESVRAIRLSMSVPLPDSLADIVSRLGGLDGALLVDPRHTVSVGRTTIEDAWSTLGIASAVHGEGADGVTRQPHAFFQSHRYLLPRLVQEVLARIKTDTVVDLYSGVGLFGLAAVRQGVGHASCVEADSASSEDLARNAAAFGSRVTVTTSSVERWLIDRRVEPTTTVVIDPPRTGLSAEALTGLARLGAASIVYVSCDLATFARDVAKLAQHGYEPAAVQPLDLFPDTGHVEVVATLDKASHA